MKYQLIAQPLLLTPLLSNLDNVSETSLLSLSIIEAVQLLFRVKTIICISGDGGLIIEIRTMLKVSFIEFHLLDE